MLNATDEELCRGIVENDLQAFKCLYERYNNAIFTYAFKLSRSRELALDTVQDVFMKIWIRQKMLDPQLSIKAYLYRSARNLILDHMKKAVHDDKFRHNFLCSYEEAPATIDQVLYTKQLEEIRTTAIEKLPGQRKLIYKLSKVNGLSNQEIADKLGISNNTVKDQLYKAARYIRQYLYQHADIAILITAISKVLEK